MDDKVTDELANYAHAAWSGWIGYLFAKSIANEDGTITIPQWAVDRWNRQAKTPYADLPENEKDSDRDEARKMLAVIESRQAQEAPKAESVELNSLLCAINRVTAYHRHGNAIPKDALDNLSNRQIDAEDWLEADRAAQRQAGREEARAELADIKE
jgi:hypothetical protein